MKRNGFKLEELFNQNTPKLHEIKRSLEQQQRKEFSKALKQRKSTRLDWYKEETTITQ